MRSDEEIIANMVKASMLVKDDLGTYNAAPRFAGCEVGEEREAFLSRCVLIYLSTVGQGAATLSELDKVVNIMSAIVPLPPAAVPS